MTVNSSVSGPAVAPRALVAALPRYRLGGELGRGGFGVVYAARDPRLDRAVAVKHLPNRIAADPQMRLRFNEEGRALARLSHLHIVTVYEYADEEVTVDATGPPERVCALVLEHLPGGTLAERFRRVGLTMEQSCAAVLAVLSAAQAAHDQGLLHRDIKPGNVMFDSRGTVKVTDFGLARVIGGETTLASRDGRFVIAGTPGYMSPEQSRGDYLDVRTDVYSATAMLYYLLAGRLPYPTEGGFHRFRAHQDAAEPPLPGDEVPSGLAWLLMRGLARDPERRPASAEQFAESVAAAASEAFGPGWLERSELAVRDLSPAVRTALESSVRRGPSGRGEESVLVTDLVPALSGTPVGRPSPGIVDLDQASLVPLPELSATGQQQGRAHRRRPPSVPVPLRQLAGTALAAVVLMVLVAVLWPSPQPAVPTGPTAAEGIQVAGATPPAVARVDLAEPVEISGTAAASGTVTVLLRLSVAGIPLGTATGDPVTVNAGEPWRTDVTAPPLTRWIAGGAVHGQVRLDRAGTSSVQEVTIEPRQTPPASVMGAGGVLAALFALAYLESTRRLLRDGSRQGSAVFAAGALGAVLGFGVWLSAATLSRQVPVAAAGICCVLLGAAAATAAAAASRSRARAGG
ncbi:MULTISPECIES: serine/threonine-protein kinase [Protofrankia]|uniref:non-specific serine/threonine protein kinase n=1 Tax=Candidatus Protofrankia datiscae TaxID=2716812 RepID=F8B044_9ACTN|nr:MULTISPECIES: serine/threonine-protein kinase [Protofrankia]AEH11743.1 serine/threonine protein kinase [Candidatus Protofrankia datiscae]